MLTDTRGEAAKYRRQRNDYKSKLETAQSPEIKPPAKADDDQDDDQETKGRGWKKRAEDAERSLAEFRTQMNQLQSSLEQVQVQSIIQKAASTRGFIDPGDVIAHVGDQLEIDEDGPTNLDALLDELATQKPYLLKANEDNRQSKLRPGGGENKRKAGEPSASFKQFTGIDQASPFEAGGIEFPEA